MKSRSFHPLSWSSTVRSRYYQRSLAGPDPAAQGRDGAGRGNMKFDEPETLILGVLFHRQTRRLGRPARSNAGLNSLPAASCTGTQRASVLWCAQPAVSPSNGTLTCMFSLPRALASRPNRHGRVEGRGWPVTCVCMQPWDARKATLKAKGAACKSRCRVCSSEDSCTGPAMDQSFDVFARRSSPETRRSWQDSPVPSLNPY